MLLWPTQDRLTRVDIAGGGEQFVEFSEEAPPFPTAVAASPDGRWMAIGGLDGSIRIVDAESLEPAVRLAAHAGNVVAVDWVPGRDRIVSLGGDRQILVSDLRSPPAAPSSSWAGSTGFPLTHVVMSATQRVVEVRDPSAITAASVEVWSSGSVAEPVDLEIDAANVVLGRGADGTALAAARRASVRSGIVAFDPSSGTVVLDRPGELDRPLALTPDGRTLIVTMDDSSAPRSDPRIVAIDIESGAELWSLDGVRSQSSSGTGTPVGFVRDGTVVFVATGDPYDPSAPPPELLALDMSSGAEIASRPLRSPHHHLAVSPDGDRLATADGGGRLSVLDVEMLLGGAADAEIGSTELPSGDLPFGMAFGDDGTILYTPAGFLTAELLALAIDDDLSVRWSIDVSDVANTVSRRCGRRRPRLDRRCQPLPARRNRGVDAARPDRDPNRSGRVRRLVQHAPHAGIHRGRVPPIPRWSVCGRRERHDLRGDARLDVAGQKREEARHLGAAPSARTHSPTTDPVLR